MINKELQQEIITWHKSVFADAELESQVLKWQEEYRELEQADDYATFLEEYADCIIVATSFLRYGEIGETLNLVFMKFLESERNDWNIDKEEIEEAVERKLKINKERNWFKNSQGIYKHK